MAAPEVDQSTIVFHSPDWIHANGGWLHGNNVLFYFAESPFFDRMSGNNTIFQQSIGNYERQIKFLGNREVFEKELQKYTGIQYVVVSDPIIAQVKLDGPDGQYLNDSTWVIRKQNRLTPGPDGEIQILDYYYILQNVIFQAPRLESILNYRMMNTIHALNKIVDTTSDLEVFSPTYGHSYFRPGQKTASAEAAVSAQPSRIGTPRPEQAVEDAAGEHGMNANEQTDQDKSDVRTLREALNLTMRFGAEYYDDAPLAGEPGNFRYGKSKDPVQNLKVAETQPSVKAGSAAPSRGVTPAATSSSLPNQLQRRTAV